MENINKKPIPTKPGTLKLTLYPNIDTKKHPNFIITVQEANDNDLLHLLNDWCNAYLYNGLKTAPGFIEVITNEIQIRIGSLKYEICCECGCAVPLNRLTDHPVICGDYTK